MRISTRPANHGHIKPRPLHRCECVDLLCPVHEGKECLETTKTGVVLRRIDMQDKTGTRFCGPCAQDAYDSGLYTR